MLARGAAGTRARAELCMSAVWHSRVNHLSIAGGKGEQNTGQGSRFIKAEPSFFWSFFLFSFSVYLFFFFFDQWRICPNWHFYYGRRSPGRREALGECEHCVQGGG